MAFGHGIGADFTLAGSSVKDYVESIDATFEREIADIKTLGTVYVQRLAGHKMGSFALSGAFDPTVDAAVYNAWNGDTTVAWTFLPQSTVTYSGNCRVTNYTISAGADAVRISFDLVSDGTISRA
jgi:predicted secreted protein